MKLLLFVHDITASKAHLMPWRTVCEITEGLRNMGHEATLVSLDKFKGPVSGLQLPSGSVAIRKNQLELVEDLKYLERTYHPDVVWPVSWRDPLYRIKALGQISSAIVGWFPGGNYDKASTFYALRRLGIRTALPYLSEAWAPKKRQVERWKKYNIRHQLVMTSHTANAAIAGGYSPDYVFAIPPGRENIDKEIDSGPLDLEVRTWLGSRKYFLFMGPPSSIRGIFELLSAFNIAARRDKSICLVCLFRSDGVLDREKISQTIFSMSEKECIYVRWASVSQLELNSFINAAYVTVMPFVIVPSEIPLAVIESARWGKPVVTTRPGGTSEYVDQFGCTSRVGDIDGLVDSMLELSCNRDFYQKKSRAAISTYRNHPTWKRVSEKWLEVATKAMELG